MMKKSNWGWLTAACLLTAVIAHGFMLSEWMHGRYVTGPNDGMSQMIPFKYLLYESMNTGNFFYSERFGFGGGIFSQLGYYFSTSIVFLLTAAGTGLLQWSGIIGEPSLHYWADVTVFVSMIRLTGILLVTVYYFRMVGLKTGFAYIGAVIYGVSILYFRHVTYWEFFADAMLFLPILLIGAERIIRFGKPGWFIAAVALSMVDNFYFAYINFLLTFSYIGFRWFIPLVADEQKRMGQIGQFLASGLVGAAISAPFFVPAVYGYLNNFRPPFEGEIPLFEMTENILSDGKLVVIPAIAAVSLFLYPLYRDKKFRLFALLTSILIILHASPAVGSLFNGLSAPQFRWEHMLMLVAGGLTAAALQHWKELRLKHVSVAIVGAFALYVIVDTMDLEGKPSLYADSLVVMALVLFAVVLLSKIPQLKHWDIALWVVVAGSVLVTVNLFQEEKLTEDNKKVDQIQGEGIPQSFFESKKYNSRASDALIGKLSKSEPDELARFDWMIGTRNNTPIVQDYLGMSVYSSILNKHLLHFYLEELAIDMGRESVSRYAGLGGRTNLYSLLNGVYAVRSEKDNPVPYGFSQVDENEELKAFKNQHRLPFVRTANRVYTEEELESSPVIAREHAMLSGVILDEWNEKKHSPPTAANLIDQVTIDPVRATYEGDRLVVTGKDGGIDLTVSDSGVLKEDAYVSFHLKRKTADKGFHLNVNDYRTTRKRTDSIYRTRVNDLTIRVPSEKVIRIRVPEGSYTLRDLALYTEDYKTLKEAQGYSSKSPAPDVNWKGGHVDVQLNNVNGDPIAVMPIPFEKGWTVKVNGKKQSILKANYAFTGVPIERGTNTIEMTYRPPYFTVSLVLSLLGLVGAAAWLVIRKKAIRSL